jgi:endonuclease/exonuclease/phosphatase family metal-dependent hydrolase
MPSSPSMHDLMTMTTIRIMTFNIRGIPETDGINVWTNRAALNVATIRACAPDLIGFQEAQADNLSTYQTQLADYKCELGPVTNRHDRLLYNVILWNPSVLSRVTTGGFYLSRALDHWSRDWDSARVRAVNWVRLHVAADGSEFLHLNAHLDHIGRQARLQGSRLIVHQLPRLNPDKLSVCLTGDFNSAPETLAGESPNMDTPYGVFRSAGFVDVYDAVGARNGKHHNTFHGFQGEAFAEEGAPSAWRLDWIMLQCGSPNVHAQSCEIVRHAAPPLYPSDHYPVIADLQID